MDPVSICNMALGFLGANKIRSLEAEEADSAEAELCSSFFEMAVRQALESCAWLFATGFIDLGAKAVAPAGEVDRVDLPARFKLPGDVIRVHRFDDGSGDFTIKAEKSGEYVVSEDTETLFAVITWYEPDPKMWTPTFCTAVAHLLASWLAGPLTQKQAIIEREEALYERALKSAKTLDGMNANTVQEVKIITSSLALRR